MSEDEQLLLGDILYERVMSRREACAVQQRQLDFVRAQTPAHPSTTAQGPVYNNYLEPAAPSNTFLGGIFGSFT